MARLFSEEWIKMLAQAWNSDPDLVNPLSDAQFSANIAYGFDNEHAPRVVIAVVNGKVIAAGSFAGQKLNWDLRASLDNWQHWMIDGFGLTSLGTAVAMQKLKFLQGDYRKMIRNPMLAKPFLRHFELMQTINTEFHS